MVYSHKVKCLALKSIYLKGPIEKVKTNGNFKPTAPKNNVFHTSYLENIYMSVYKLFLSTKSTATSSYTEIHQVVTILP